MPANPPAIIAAAPLSPKEAAELERTERVIEQAERSWYDLGAGLRLIREQRLYRGPTGKQTWEAYCLERWECSHDTARWRMMGSQVYDALKKSRQFVVLPIRESHVRPLTYLEPADWPRAWARTLELAGRRRVTAKHAEVACTEVLGRPPGAPPGAMSTEQMIELLSGRLGPDRVHAILAAKEEEVRQAERSAAEGRPASPWWLRLRERVHRRIDRRASDRTRGLFAQAWQSLECDLSVG